MDNINRNVYEITYTGQFKKDYKKNLIYLSFGYNTMKRGKEYFQLGQVLIQNCLANNFTKGYNYIFLKTHNNNTKKNTLLRLQNCKLLIVNC